MAKKPSKPAPAAGDTAAPRMDLQSALAIEQANAACGFPTPPEVQAVIDQADAGEVEQVRGQVDEAASFAADDLPSETQQDPAADAGVQE